MSRLNARPAGLSSDSDTDAEFEFGSDIKFSTNYEKTNLRDNWSKSNPYNWEDSDIESSNEEVSNDVHKKVQGIGSLQNAEISSQAQYDSSCLTEPSIVVTQNNSVENGGYDIPLLLDVSNCDFKDYLGNGRETSSNNGSHSSLSSYKLPPNSGRKSPRHQGMVLPLEEFRMASVQGNLAVIKSLQNQGISVDQILKSGWTALMYASSCGKDELVLYLLQQGADPNLHKELFTALMAACASSQESESGLLSCVNHLLNYGAKPDACERHRMTPLMFACKEGRVTIVDVLLKAKVDVNKQDNKGWTALSWAATKGHGRVVRKLLLYAADASKVNTHGQRPSDIALSAGYVEIADILERAETTQGGNTFNSEDMKLLERSKSSPNISKSLKPISVTSTCNEMEMVLNGLDLANLIPLFQNHKITLECFLRLHENDFERIGIAEIGTRKKLLNAIADIHKQEWKTSSLPNLYQCPYITLPDAVSLISNINKQIRFIHASIGYMRDQIQASPRILELGQEKYNVTSLSNSFSTSLKNISSLGEEVKFFKAHLDKVCDNVEYSTADLIVVKKDDGRRWQRSLLASLIVATSFAVGIWYCRPKTFASIFSLVPYPQSSVFLDIVPETYVQ